MVKQYTKDSLQPWMNKIREWREEGLEEVIVNVADLAITQDHIEDLELLEKRCEQLEHKLENGRQRYEANLMSLEDCSKMTTQKELKIRELKKQIAEKQLICNECCERMDFPYQDCVCNGEGRVIEKTNYKDMPYIKGFEPEER